MNTKGTILVVDDTPADLELLVDTLTAQGYQVLPAESGELALASVAARPPELILLDIHLPGLNGFEVCRLLQAQPESRDIPVMFISASGESAERVEGLRLGAVDYISKPFQREELLARVQIQVELGRLRVRLAQQAADLQRANEQLRSELAERKQAELEIQRQAAFPRFNPNPVLELSAVGEINYCNDAAEDMTRSLGLKNPEQILPPNTAGIVRACLATGRPTLRVENQIGPRVISWSFFPVQHNHTVHCYAGDITERKRAEESLRASQQLIEGIINAIPVRVFWKDKNLVSLGCNAVFARDAGFAEPKDLIGKDDYQMGWRDQTELYRAGDRQVIESGCARPLVEEPQTTPEGNTITLLTSKIPLRGSNGEVSGMIGTSMDVTDRRQAEEALRRASELLLRTGELAKVGGWELDLQSMKLFWSLETCRIHEVDPPVAPALDQAIHFYAPEARPVVRAAVQAGIEHGTPFDLDLPLTTAKGRPIWVRAQGTAVMEDGKAVKLLGAFQDITERKRAEGVLREVELRLAHAMSLAQLAAWEYDVASGLFTFSDRYYVLHGTTTALEGGNRMSAEDFVRRFVHPDDAHLVAEEVGKAVTTADPDYRTQLESRILRRDGELRQVLIHISITKDAAGRTIQLHGANQDITEHKVAEARLAGLQKQLLDASRQAGMAEVATNVLHNVGNVLNSVNISTTLVVQSVKQSKASSLARVVVLLREHAHDLGEFITNDSRGKHLPALLAQLSEHLLAEQETNLRELASLRRNVEHIKEIVTMQQNYATFGGLKELINVADLVEDSLRLNQGALARHRVEVVREFETVPPMNLEKHKFLQIMVNLLRNAKHACQDSERADKRLTVRVANGEGRIRISVIDNGVGIPPENLTRIFNYGFTTRKGGHGFGLHSGALAAKEMGGSLTVHSDGPGQGAAFTLELPVLPSHETDSADSEPRKPNS
jgi:PAS domain S-box-containing protein